MPIDETEKRVWAEREIAAPAAEIFAVLADPSRHREIDGSDTVRDAFGESRRLELGDKFGMRMRWGVPYVIRNKVVEYERDALIAWAHPGGHRWRYELDALTDDRTKVTETFDWSTALSPWLLEKMGIPEAHVGDVERTLERLEAVVTA